MGALRLNRNDIERVAEFFDCDIAAAVDFARKIWFPDACDTTRRIGRAIVARDVTSLLYLCDHLREGARTVGAHRIIQYASDIEFAVRQRRWAGLTIQIADLKRYLEEPASLFPAECIQ